MEKSKRQKKINVVKLLFIFQVKKKKQNKDTENEIMNQFYYTVAIFLS